MYICPMHPEEKQSQPGECPICHMALEDSEAKSTVIHSEQKETIWPVIIVFIFLLILVAIVEFVQGRFDLLEALRIYMAGFFIIFGSFKLLDLKGFVMAYQEYDILAQRSKLYAFLYPFLELGLGLAYLFSYHPKTTSIITFVIMSLGSVGVIKALRAKTKLQCACLGTLFKLPMTKVTLFEDVSMALMALVMILIILF